MTGRTLEELATLVSGWAATERRLFEVVGGWVRTVEPPAVKAMLAAHSRHHGWRATVWADVVPVAVGFEPIEAVDVEVAGLSGVDDLDRLYAELLPRLRRAYSAFVDGAGPAEAAVARWGRLVAVDLERDLDEAARVLVRSPA